MTPPPLATREMAREARFAPVWSEELNKVFADVAPYYDRANDIATLGLCDEAVALQRCLIEDVCGGPGKGRVSPRTIDFWSRAISA